MKISHNASPRNRSSRSSRSPVAGNDINGFDLPETAATSGAIASAAPASGGPAIRSAMEVIWHRSLSGLVDKLVDSSARTTRAAYILFAKIVSLDPPQASAARILAPQVAL